MARNVQVEGMGPFAASRLALPALAAALALVGSAGAQSLETPERLASIARAAAARETGRPESELEVGVIDARLRLAACAVPPVARLAPGTRSAAQLTMELRCASPPWRQFVAVRVHAEEPVAIAAGPLGRGQVLRAEDVAIVSREIGSLPAGYFRRAEEVIGRLAQRTIGPGELLLPQNVRPPALVRRGQTVTLLAHAGSFQVRSSGIAENDGGLEERVRVRSAGSGRMVEGVVRSGDTVEVSLE
ncbi:MAG: flagellar basal body P-ring formation protein FlgA [Proteobacteria bacterium]|nr:flagellar basal body P-ring formation protein FlgA [Pseudomonadota bacterium]